MSTMFRTILFRIISSANATASQDAMINIKRNGDVYYWRYSSPDVKTHDVNWYEREEVFSNLRTMAGMLADDDDKNASVQVFIPGFPTVLFDIDKFPKALENHIFPLMETCFDNWPVVMTTDEAKNADDDNADPEMGDDEDSNAGSDDEDDGEESESDEDDDEETESESDSDSYSSMPGLISQDEMNAAYGLYTMKNAPFTPPRPVKKRECPPAPARPNCNDCPSRNTRSKTANTIEQCCGRRLSYEGGKTRVHTFFA